VPMSKRAAAQMTITGRPCGCRNTYVTNGLLSARNGVGRVGFAYNNSHKEDISRKFKDGCRFLLTLGTADAIKCLSTLSMSPVSVPERRIMGSLANGVMNTPGELRFSKG
jgi:hypothetical protein